MRRSTTGKQIALAAQAGELMFAAPQVIAHRMGRMMLGEAGARDRREFRRMGTEKAEAANEAFNNVAAQLARSAQGAASTYAQAWWRAWMQLYFPFLAPGGRARFPVWGMTPGQMHHAALDVMGQAMRPVHRRAVANAKRLSKPRR